MALTIDTVADAAMNILADFGLGDLTMRRLARELGVQPSALYWHVADKQSLFVLLAARMAAEADTVRENGTDTGPPSTRIDDLLAYRQVLLQYRESADIVLLAYAHSGASVLPAALAGIDAGRRDIVTAFVLGTIALHQTRRLFADSLGVTATENPEGDTGVADASFCAGLTKLLTD